MDRIVAVNFLRLLDRCYGQALHPDQRLQQWSHLQKFVYMLREQAEALGQTSEGRDYLDTNECPRKLAFLYQAIGFADPKSTSHPATSTQAENSARIKYRNQAMEQQRAMLFRKSAPFEAADAETPASDEPAEIQLESSTSERPRDEKPPPLTSDRGELRQRSADVVVTTAATSAGDRSSNVALRPGSIDEERARHDELSGALIHLSQSLIHRAKDIGKHVRNDNKILDNVEGQSRTSVEEIGDQHKQLKRHQRESGWYACGTYCLLVLVAVTFLVTYLMVKMFRKAS